MESIHGRMFVTRLGRGLFILGLRKSGDVGVSFLACGQGTTESCLPARARLCLVYIIMGALPPTVFIKGKALSIAHTRQSLARARYDHAPEPVRKTVQTGLLSWFVLNSGGYIASGNASNALFNLLVLLLAVRPLGVLPSRKDEAYASHRSREALPGGVWNPKKCPKIRAATRAAPTKTGFLICNLPEVYISVVGAALVVAHISKIPDTSGQSLARAGLN